MTGESHMNSELSGNHVLEARQHPRDAGAQLPSETGAAFQTSLEHVLAELECLDVLIEAQIRRARECRSHDDLQGLYISELEVDQILAHPIGMPHWATVPLAKAAPDV